MKNQTGTVALVASTAVDYFAWTQLTPMLLGWAGAVGILALMYFVNFQEESWNALDAIGRFLVSIPWFGDAFVAWMEEKTGGDGTIDTEDLKSMALTVWVVGALAFFLTSLAFRALFGPFKPWSLTRKLKLAALACSIMLIGLFWLYRVAGQDFNGPFIHWVFGFFGMALLLFLVSAYGLAVSHALGLLSQSIRDGSLSGKRNRPETPVSHN